VGGGGSTRLRCKVFIDYQFLFAFVGSGREQTSTRFFERLSRVSITVRGKRDSSYFYFFTKKTKTKDSTAKKTFMFEKSGNTSYLMSPESSAGGFFFCPRNQLFCFASLYNKNS